jgi:hypothetical protein
MRTRNRISGKRIAPLVLAATAAGLAVNSTAQANLTISLQLAGGATSALIVGTTPIEIDVWAQVTANLPSSSYAPESNDAFPGGAADYGFEGAYFGVVSTQVYPTGDVTSSGGLTSAALEPWDRGSLSKPGILGDTNGDGAADNGENPETEEGNNVAYAVGATAQTAWPNPVPANDPGIPAGDVQALPGGGYEFLLERMFFTPSMADATTVGRQISYSPVIPTSTRGGPALWVEDGTPTVRGAPGDASPGMIIPPNPNPLQPGVPDPGNFLVGSSVLLYETPEPASVSLMSFVAIGLLARRRKA